MLSTPVHHLPTVIHITSRRTHDLRVSAQKGFLRKVLGVNEKQQQDDPSMNWESIIAVVNGKGQEY